MKTHPITKAPEIVESDWITFPGGELEGKRPSVLCPACRASLTQAANSPLSPRPANSRPGSAPVSRSRHLVCFQCYRVSVARERALKAAGEIDTASEERFQSALPFEPVNRARLHRLQAERATARTSAAVGLGRFVDRRRQAQIAARHALERIVVGLRARNAATAQMAPASAQVMHAAELQLPEAWLPFVSSR